MGESETEFTPNKKITSHWNQMADTTPFYGSEKNSEKPLCLWAKINKKTPLRNLQIAAMAPPRIFFSSLSSASTYSCYYGHQHRWISSTTQLDGWMDKIKGVISGQKTTTTPQDPSQVTAQSFTLPRMFHSYPTLHLSFLSLSTLHYVKCLCLHSFFFFFVNY